MRFFINKTIKLLLAIALSTGLLSCEGVFNNLYDDAVPSLSAEMDGNKVTVDASNYTEWAYINFRTMAVENVEITDGEQKEPESWDIAIHRFQAKTNGGAVLETNFSTIDELLAYGALPSDEFQEDTWYEEKVITDLSGMMSGNIRYEPSFVNDVLCRWITSSGMPPVYTTSDKVYVVRLSDNTLLALRLESYMDNSGTKGFMTYSYVYPLQFE